MSFPGPPHSMRVCGSVAARMWIAGFVVVASCHSPSARAPEPTREVAAVAASREIDAATGDEEEEALELLAELEAAEPPGEPDPIHAGQRQPANLSASPDRVPAAAIPAELARAPAWVYRLFSTFGIPRPCGEAPHQATTYTLRRHSSHALLTITTRTAPNPPRSTGSSFEIGTWSPRTTRSYFGTVESRGPEVSLSLVRVAEGVEDGPTAEPRSGAGERPPVYASDPRCQPAAEPPAEILLQCTPTTVSAAAATAALRPRRHSENCDSDGRWVPGRSRAIAALECWRPKDDPRDRGWVTFAAAPGVEWLLINDDCRLQDGGWRRIPKDGSIAEPR